MSNGACWLCRTDGVMEEGTTTRVYDTDGRVLVLRDVPAYVCCQCGEEVVSPDVERKLTKIVERLLAKKEDIIDTYYDVELCNWDAENFYKRDHTCAFCGNVCISRNDSYTYTRKGHVIVIRNVPMSVCVECGEKSFWWNISKKLSAMVDLLLERDERISIGNYDELLTQVQLGQEGDPC